MPSATCAGIDASSPAVAAARLLDLRPRALDGGVERGRVRAACRRLCDPLLRPLECQLIHGREATLSAGWTPPSSSTSCRRS